MSAQEGELARVMREKREREAAGTTDSYEPTRVGATKAVQFSTAKREVEKVKMMPADGIPAQIGGRWGSQLQPAEFTPEEAERAAQEHGWVPHVPRETPSLEELSPTRETVKMVGPKDGGAVEIVGEDGKTHLYPGGVFDANLDDVAGLAAKGFNVELNDEARPSASDWPPGTRWVDPVSGTVHVIDASQSWYRA